MGCGTSKCYFDEYKTDICVVFELPNMTKSDPIHFSEEVRKFFDLFPSFANTGKHVAKLRQNSWNTKN